MKYLIFIFLLGFSCKKPIPPLPYKEHIFLVYYPGNTDTIILYARRAYNWSFAGSNYIYQDSTNIVRTTAPILSLQ